MGTAALIGAQMAASVLAASESAKNQAKMSRMEMEAAARNTAAANEEFTRQQQEVDRVAGEQKTDRQRVYDQDIGAIRVAAAEGMGSVNRFAAQAGYLLGTDLSRIEANREGQVESMQSRKVAASVDAKNVVQRERNKTEVATSNILFSAVGSGVQIASDYQKQRTMSDLLKNPKTS